MTPDHFQPIRRRGALNAPLAFAQESLWYLQQLRPDSPAYNIKYLFRLVGLLNVPAMERAINEIIRRHEILRTIFSAQDGIPEQVVLPYAPRPLPLIDLSSLPEEEREHRVRQLADEEGYRPFDLSRPPLLRILLVKTGESVHSLILTAHHNIFDAWSRQIFIEELLRLYTAALEHTDPQLSELPIQYSDYALWQREMLQGELMNELLAHWSAQFTGHLPVLDLPVDRPRSAVQTYRGRRVRRSFNSAACERMRALCRGERVTLFMLMLAALDVLLRCYTGEEDIIVGCPFADRSRPEFDRLIGMLLNTLPVRVDLSGDPSFRELLGRIRNAAFDAYTFRALPFEKLVAEINPERDLSHTPVFQVVLNLVRTPKRLHQAQGLILEELLIDNVPAAFDLEIEILDEDPEILCSFRYNSDLFDETTIQRMLGHFQIILAEVVAHPDLHLSDLQILTPAERHQILVEWNNTATQFPDAQCVHRLFEKQVERAPDAQAVICDDERVTYAELNRRANQLGHYLLSKGIGMEGLVGIYVNRSVDMIVAQLGVLKAGGAYLPLDLNLPRERLRIMLQDAKPACVITSSWLAADLPYPSQALVMTDAVGATIAQGNLEEPEAMVSPENLAYVSYTSGSTGVPKGVMLEHRGVVNYLCSMISSHQLGAQDRILQLTSLSFDPSVRDTLGVLAFGGCVVLMNDSKMFDPLAILEAIQAHGVTGILSIVPTRLNELTGTALQTGFQNRTLRLLMVSGEAFFSDDARRAAEAFGEQVKLVNQYGPTECSMIATIQVLAPEILSGPNRILPIGRPIANVCAYVLDHSLHLAPIGVKGDLYIGGVGVGRGYLSRPDLTAERFIPDPFSSRAGARLYKTGDLARTLPDGSLEYLGRSDFQVKIRGNRVELGEIESVLRQHPSVQEAAAALWEDLPQGPQLAAYFTSADANRMQISALRDFLAERLPSFMLPTFLIPLPALPLTPNHKVDRRALPRPTAVLETSNVIARSETERTLADVWQTVLQIEPIGVLDSFFDLGGDSLRAVQMLVRVNARLGLNLTLRDLFESPTIAALAERIERQGI